MSDQLESPDLSVGRKSTKRIPDPTVKTNLPTNLLHSISTCDARLMHLEARLARCLDLVGWSEGGAPVRNEGPHGTTALDCCRYNVATVEFLHKLVDELERTLGTASD